MLGRGLRTQEAREAARLEAADVPFTGEEVYVERGLRDRKMQQALMQFFKPENHFQVREALLQAGRQNLIGGG